jgi:hypothetical protein
MKLINGEMVTLEDELEYIVINTVTYENIDYALLMTASKPISMMIVIVEEDEEGLSIVPIGDQEKAQQILELITKA